MVGGKSLGSREYENRFWAIRFTADGRADPSFGGPAGVKVQIPIPPRADPYPSHREGGAHDIAVQDNGKVLLAGDYDQDGEGQVETHGAVVRLLPDGSLDTGFGGGDGIVTVPNGGYGFEDV